MNEVLLDLGSSDEEPFDLSAASIASQRPAPRTLHAFELAMDDPRGATPRIPSCEAKGGGDYSPSLPIAYAVSP